MAREQRRRCCSRHGARRRAPRRTGKAAEEAAAFSVPGQLRGVEDYLLAPESGVGALPSPSRDSLLLSALDDAVAELTQRFGATIAWVWARYTYGPPPSFGASV